LVDAAVVSSRQRTLAVTLVVTYALVVLSVAANVVYLFICGANPESPLNTPVSVWSAIFVWGGVSWLAGLAALVSGVMHAVIGRHARHGIPFFVALGVLAAQAFGDPIIGSIAWG
jgi:hypothetical protein